MLTSGKGYRETSLERNTFLWYIAISINYQVAGKHEASLTKIADTKKKRYTTDKNIYYQVITMSKNLSFLGIHIIISAQKKRKKDTFPFSKYVERKSYFHWKQGEKRLKKITKIGCRNCKIKRSLMAARDKQEQLISWSATNLQFCKVTQLFSQICQAKQLIHHCCVFYFLSYIVGSAVPGAKCLLTPTNITMSCIYKIINET